MTTSPVPAQHPPDVPAGRRRIPLRATCAQPHACSPEVRFRVLQHVDLFRDLTPDQLASVNARMIALSWAEGDPLHQAGESADHLYVLASGRAKALLRKVIGKIVVNMTPCTASTDFSAEPARMPTQIIANPKRTSSR